MPKTARSTSTMMTITRFSLKLLREYIQNHTKELKDLSIIKPYSFFLVDDEKENICELYLVDDDMIVIDSSSLMQNLDKDLDDFFDRLMKD